MKLLKQIVSTILLLALLVGMIPTNVMATDTSTSVQNGQPTVEGTNSFGSLLSEDIQEQQEADDEDYSGGYNVIGLTIENNVATVEYDSLEEAMLVVALYTEDGLKLLVSGNTIVQPEASEATVTLEGEIPEYFMASAYLLDTYDYSPLCAAYDTPMYTKEMQELLASTTDDYDPDKILNLDSDKNTNFAVYADTTKVLECTEGVNTVISADDETATYVIDNADSNITDLQTGDILAYAYGENQILIVKVSSVTVDGSTATITGSDLEMEEVFTHVKIENESTTSDFTVDESNLQEGVTFDGFVENGAVFAARPGDTTIGTSKSIAMTLDVKDGTDIGPVELSVKLAGSLKLDLEAEFSYYVSFDRQFLEFKTDVSTTVSITVSGKLEMAIPLVKLNFSPIPGVGIGFTPEFKVEVSAKMEISATWSATVGISYENGKGFQNLNTAPETEVDASVSGKIFIGLDLFPNANVLGGTVIELGLSAPVGFELSAELTGTAHDIKESDAEDIHACENCLEMELVFKLELSVELTLLKIFSYEHKLITKEHKLGDLYYSFDHDELAWGICPYKSYRVTVYVQDSNNKAVADIDVVAGWAEKLSEIPLGKTNSNGVLVCYLQEGTYTFMANVDGENLGKTITVEEACKVNLNKASINSGPIFISGVVNPDSLTDHGAIIATGECGATGNNVIYTLYSSGLLTIFGSGDMAEYSSSQRAPWYQYRTRIQSVKFDGITNIGAYAFFDCSYITRVEMPQNLVLIGDYAFFGCSLLSNISIPNGVTKVGRLAFWAAGLETLTLPDGVTDIGSGAFQSCQKLTYVYIPESVVNVGTNVFTYASRLISAGPSGSGSNIEFGWVSSIPRRAFHGAEIVTAVLPFGIKCVEDNAFEKCMKLVDVQLPKSITEIGYYAFYDCQSLGAIGIPEGTESISTAAFCNCKSLKKIVIPESVKSINMTAFSNCTSITSVGPIGSGCDYEFGWSDHIPAFAFRGFSGLKKVIIPESINSFGNAAFALCTNLKNAGPIGSGCDYEFGWTEAIPNRAFDECTGMTAVILPDSITSIGERAFNYCTALKDVYYGGTITQWSEISIEGGNLDLTAATIHYESTGMDLPEIEGYQEASDIVAEQDTYIQTASAENEDENVPVLFSVHDGEYSTEITDTYTLKTASFTGLVPGEQYVLLALVSIEVDNILAPENLLYIDQDTAAEDGALSFTYAQREVTDKSYVMACGASNKNLSNAVITFPDMTASEEMQAVQPVVVYDGKILTEGIDYVVVGTVAYTAAGEYTCYVRGIYNFSGLVQCQYTVIDTVPGDVNSDGVVDTLDRMVLSRYLANWDEYDEASINIAAADVNGDGVVDTLDRMVLNRHLANWDGYETLPYVG